MTVFFFKKKILKGLIKHLHAMLLVIFSSLYFILLISKCIFQESEAELAECEEYQAAEQVLKDTLNAVEGLVN